MGAPHRAQPLSNVDREPEILPCSQCLLCVHACPTKALRYHHRVWSLDLNLCHFCGECAEVCPNQLISMPKAATL